MTRNHAEQVFDKKFFLSHTVFSILLCGNSKKQKTLQIVPDIEEKLFKIVEIVGSYSRLVRTAGPPLRAPLTTAASN